jgi:hypothetical protein
MRSGKVLKISNFLDAGVFIKSITKIIKITPLITSRITPTHADGWKSFAEMLLNVAQTVRLRLNKLTACST